MSTRGTFGILIDGQEKIAYNHSDSYPSGLGLDIRDWLVRSLAMRPEVLPHQARALRLVDMDSEPTDAEIQQLKRYYNPNVDGPRARPTWYQLLRETQGEFVARDTYDASLGGSWAFDALPSIEEFLASFEGGAE
jgi:hypothetical protein